MQPNSRNSDGWLDKALSGERQMVFVTGEPGIGKAALVEAFVAQLGVGPTVRMVHRKV